ncbi:hypothetical protein CE91St14_18790 [Porphyromonas somerae]|nr:hypothetical protein CE91St14_18790 [Porphyromonas somerae]
MCQKDKNVKFSVIVDDYLKRGFGSFNKNDFEVYIFNWLVNNKYQNKSDFEISRELRIPESKIKRMRYEASLKYEKLEPNDYRELLLQALKSAKYREGSAEYKISMSISNKNLRLYLQDLLNKDGRFYDSSFNANIVTMPVADLIFVLDELIITESDKESIMNTIKNTIPEGKAKLPKTVSENLKELGKDALQDFATKIIGVNTSDKIRDLISKAIINNQGAKKCSANSTKTTS